MEFFAKQLQRMKKQNSEGTQVFCLFWFKLCVFEGQGTNEIEIECTAKQKPRRGVRMVGKVGSCQLSSHSLAFGHSTLQLSAFPLPHSSIGREGVSARGISKTV